MVLIILFADGGVWRGDEPIGSHENNYRDRAHSCGDIPVYAAMLRSVDRAESEFKPDGSRTRVLSATLIFLRFHCDITIAYSDSEISHYVTAGPPPMGLSAVVSEMKRG